MAWIRMIADDEADDATRAAYAEARAARGGIANILRVHGVRPDVLTSHLHFYVSVMFGRSELSRAEREMLAVAVSRANDCFY